MSDLTDKFGSRFDELLLKIQMGNVNGAKIIWKFGFSDINIAGVQNTVEDGVSGIYIYHIGFGADARQIDVDSDTPLSDDGRELYIEGLDADGNEQSEIILVGETTVNTYSRLFRMFNNNGIPTVGDVHAYETGTANIIAHLHTVSQSTLMSMYTIPKGKIGYLFRGNISVGSGKEVLADNMVRKKDGIFAIAERITLYQSTAEVNRPYIPIPELSDMEVRITPTQQNTPISATFGLLILDKDKFNLT